MITNDDQTADTGDDDETFTDESDDGDDPVLGIQLNAGYTFSNDSMSAGATVQFGIVDFAAIGDGFLISIMPTFAMPGVAGLSVGAEFDILLLGTGVTGIGIGAQVGASIMGISPTLAFYNKSADFGGDDSLDFFDADDVTDTSMMSEFNTTDLAAATGIAFDLSVDLAELMGMKLLTIGYGLDMFLAEAGYTNVGMDGSIGLDLSEVLGQPLTVGFSMGQYAENDLTWAGTIGYTYAEIFMASLTVEQTEADVVGYSIGGSVSF